MSNATYIDFIMKEGDELPPLRVPLRDGNGLPIDLTGATVRLRVQNRDTGAFWDDLAMTLDGDPTNGYVNYAWAAGNDAGIYNCAIIVTYPSAKVQTFPTDGYLVMEIQPQLPPISLSPSPDDLNSSPYLKLYITNPQVGDELAWDGAKWTNIPQAYWWRIYLTGAY